VLALGLGAVAAGCGGDDESDSAATSSSSSLSSSTEGPSSSSSSSTTSTPATPEEEVEAAYLRSWEVYAKAVRELDPSGLEESYARDSLETVRAEVERLADANTPIRVDVLHGELVIEFLEKDVAVVFDAYINRSVLLDGSTGEPIEEPQEKTLREAYQMERLEEEWKVVFIRSLS
jgi:hypothetical protein